MKTSAMRNNKIRVLYLQDGVTFRKSWKPENVEPSNLPKVSEPKPSNLRKVSELEPGNLRKSWKPEHVEPSNLRKVAELELSNLPKVSPKKAQCLKMLQGAK
jgi:hypothetical protein